MTNYVHIIVLQYLLLVILLLLPRQAQSLPLSTKGRWIIDKATGDRVKLRCVNWAAHMPVVLAEGLDRKPISEISGLVATLGFNCVRLTWATHMFTDPRYANMSVASSLATQGLDQAMQGVKRNNPEIMTMMVTEAYEEVVAALGKVGVMVVLDNHVSKPQWCCGREDGNGFFGDLYFDPDEWVRGLDAVARRFRGLPQVVGMSMRNELRGPKQSQPSWYSHVTRGARAIHNVNPSLLVIVSGLNFDTDLSFLLSRPLPVDFTANLVYEAHWYAFSEGKSEDWNSPSKSPSSVCSAVSARFNHRAGFMAPLFVSEFGVDQRGVNGADNAFLTCFLAFAAERDVDWAMWALQGSYYRRNGVDGFEETYGVLDDGWDGPKNPNFRERFRLIQQMLQDPESTQPSYKIIYHPLTGKCLQADEKSTAVLLTDCQNRTRWIHKGEGSPIRLAGTDLCLGFDPEDSFLTLTTKCRDTNHTWTTSVSPTGFQLGTTTELDDDGKKKTNRGNNNLCLHWNSTSDSPVVFVKDCVCKGTESDCSHTSDQSQWFKLISSNV